jgi:hypothetical protein
MVMTSCEDFTGNTMFLLRDDEGQLVASSVKGQSTEEAVVDDNAVDDDEFEELFSYDDDFEDGASVDHYGYGYDDYGGECSPVTPSCSKIRYVVPANNSGCRTYFLHQGCFGRGACASCSGRTRVAGGIAAPTSQPSGIPSAAPSGVADWKESVYLFSFKIRINMIFYCGGVSCLVPGSSVFPQLDEPAREAFRQVLASTMANVSLAEVSTLKIENAVQNLDGSVPVIQGTFSTRQVTSNSSAIPGAVAQLGAASEALFLARNDALGNDFVARCVLLGSETVTANMTAAFTAHWTSEDFGVEEVQTYPPSGAPSAQPSESPTGVPSAMPSATPSRGEPQTPFICMHAHFFHA